MDAAVNCTGPDELSARDRTTPVLVRTLVERGVLRIHHLSLGLDIDGAGHPVDRDRSTHGDLHVVEPLLLRS